MTGTHLRIGQIVRPHGVRGAVKLDPLTDDTNRFRGMTEAYLEQHGELTPVPLSVLSIAPSQVIVKLDGVDTPEMAERLRGAFLCVDREHAVTLPEYTYFVADLLGAEVRDTEGGAYGRITDVMELPANDVYVVDGGKLMLPALKRLIRSFDANAQVMTVYADVLREVGLFEN